LYVGAYVGLDRRDEVRLDVTLPGRANHDHCPILFQIIYTIAVQQLPQHPT
jgi:hypothetical protein